MVISGLAVAISFFNMTMCVENEFDPILVEDALLNRQIENKQKQEEEERKQKFKERSKRATDMLDKAMKAKLMTNNLLSSLMKKKDDSP